MTIQLKDSIFIAGVHQAAGTSLTLGADVEAELVNRGVAVFTSRMLTPGENLVPAMTATDASGNTVLVGAEGTELLTFDPSGNLLANVTPRHDTLANLLLVADAGEGEIASVSDKDALVVYKGGVGEVYWKSELVAESNAFGTMDVTTGALVHFDLTDKSTATNGLFDNVGNVNLTDNTLDAVDIAQFTHLEISATVKFPSGDGTKRRAEIQYDVTGGGFWQNIASFLGLPGAEVVVPNITGESITVQVQGFIAPVSGALSDKRLRLAVSHDATGTLSGVTALIGQRAFKRT